MTFAKQAGVAIFVDRQNRFMAAPWYETWFNSPYYHILYKNRNEAEAEAFIDLLLSQLQPAPHARVLDLACGKGRYSRHLARKGFEVTGIDLAEESIRYAQQFENDRLSFFKHDMRQLFRVNYYDYIFNFFTSFGYFDSVKDDIRTLKNVAKGLRKEGLFVLDFFNTHHVKQALLGKEQKQIDGIDFHLHKWVEGKFVYKKIDISDQGQHFEFQEKVRLFTLDDFELLFKQANLQILETFGSYQLAPFSKTESPRLILLGKRYDYTT